VSLSAARKLDAYTYRDGKEKEEKKKREKTNVQIMSIMCKRELAPNIRFLLWIFMLNAYYGLLQNPATRRVVLMLSLYVSYLLLLSIFLLTLLMSIILPSYKVIEEKPRDLITLLFRVFILLPPLNLLYVYNFI